MLGAQIISSINVFSFSSNIIYLIRKTTYVDCRNVLKCGKKIIIVNNTIHSPRTQILLTFQPFSLNRALSGLCLGAYFIKL